MMVKRNYGFIAYIVILFIMTAFYVNELHVLEQTGLRYHLTFTRLPAYPMRYTDGLYEYIARYLLVIGFIPFGIIFPAKFRYVFLKTMYVSFFIIFAFHIMQMLSFISAFDIEGIVSSMIGVFIGWSSYTMFHKLKIRLIKWSLIIFVAFFIGWFIQTISATLYLVDVETRSDYFISLMIDGDIEKKDYVTSPKLYEGEVEGETVISYTVFLLSSFKEEEMTYQARSEDKAIYGNISVTDDYFDVEGQQAMEITVLRDDTVIDQLEFKPEPGNQELAFHYLADKEQTIIFKFTGISPAQKEHVLLRGLKRNKKTILEKFYYEGFK